MKKHSDMSSSLIMASGTFVSRALGFIRSFLITLVLGITGVISNAYTTGNQIPSLLYQLTAGGILTAVLVPQIIAAKNLKIGQANFINKITTLSICALSLITLVAFILSPQITYIFTISWSEENRAIATAFTYWCMPQIFFYGLYALYGGILNAKKIFAPYAWAPCANNIVIILTLLCFAVYFKVSNIDALNFKDAWTALNISILGFATTLGIIIQALILYIFIKKSKIKIKPDFKFKGTGLLSTLKTALWILALVAIDWLHTLIKTLIANSIISNDNIALTGYETASLIINMPHGIITVSIATVIFRRLSINAANKQNSLFFKNLYNGIYICLILTVLCYAVFCVASPFISAIFASTSAQILSFSKIIIAMSLCIPLMGVYYFLTRAFYALDKAKIPTFSSLIKLCIFAPVYLICFLINEQNRIIALSFLTSLTYALEIIILLLCLKKYKSPSEKTDNWLFYIKLIFCFCLTLIISFVAAYFAGLYNLNISKLKAIILTIIITIFASAVYCVLLKLFHVKQFNYFYAKALEKLRKIMHI